VIIYVVIYLLELGFNQLAAEGRLVKNRERQNVKRNNTQSNTKKTGKPNIYKKKYDAKQI